ncbi:MAG: glyoxylase family protein [Thermosediminibacterales bacterium]|nr:glyoxylase family protein [Thermosediminibacterales bacterium]
MIKSFAHVGIVVEDMEASVKFYTDILGFKFLESVDLPNLKLAFLAAGNDTIELVKYKEETIKPVADGPVSHIALKVDDIYEMIEKLKCQPVELLQEEPRDFKGGKPEAKAAKVFFFRGLNGERIELFQPPE